MDWHDSAEKHLHPLTFRLLDVGTGTRTPGSDTGWRRLPAALFETPEDGSWELLMEGDSRAFRVNPGEVAVVPAEVMHRLRVPGTETLTTTSLVAKFEAFAGLDLIEFSHIPTVLSGQNGKEIARAMKQIVALRPAAQMRVGACAKTHHLGFSVLNQALKNAEQRDIIPPAGFRHMQPALTHIRKNLTSALTRTQLANIVNLSPTRFHAVFKQATGLAPMAYVRTQRLQRARELLLQTDQAIYEIADACGFTSPYYFCRIFRKYVCQTPSQFRNAFQSQR